MAVATTLSAILWGSFLLIREPAQPTKEVGRTSQWDVVRYGWFALNATFLTLLAVLFLFAPLTVLYWEFPCQSDLFDAHQGELVSLRVSILAAGSHLTALATATWIATAKCRTNPTLRKAVTLASIASTALVCLLPVRQVVAQGRWNCARSLILLPFLPLLVGWVVYATVSRARGDL
jgi:hypothetical protein